MTYGTQSITVLPPNTMERHILGALIINIVKVNLMVSVFGTNKRNIMRGLRSTRKIDVREL